jgi:hypothetical protein
MRGEVARGSSPREEQERLNSRKAVVAALILAGLVLLAAAVFLWVVLARACSGSHAGP